MSPQVENTEGALGGWRCKWRHLRKEGVAGYRPLELGKRNGFSFTIGANQRPEPFSALSSVTRVYLACHLPNILPSIQNTLPGLIAPRTGFMRSPLPASSRHIGTTKARPSRVLGARLYLLQVSLAVLPVGQKAVPRFESFALIKGPSRIFCRRPFANRPNSQKPKDYSLGLTDFYPAYLAPLGALVEEVEGCEFLRMRRVDL